MAAIIEIQDVEHLSDYAEKVMKYSSKLVKCLEEIGESGGYMERYGKRRRMKEDEEYPRYY